MASPIRSGALIPCSPAVAFLLLLRQAAEAAPKADLWPRWQAHDPNATAALRGSTTS